jgi:predicted nucleotidyltransferase
LALFGSTARDEARPNSDIDVIVLGIDNNAIWSIVRDDVPSLAVNLRQLRQRISDK